MKTKKIGIILILVTMIVILTGGNVKAALQANPNTHMKKKNSLVNWATSIRQMEASDGAMGLGETIGSDLTSNGSNEIDVHLMRSTEYGAMAILAASGYGNPSNEKIKTTTTGNNTGVILSTGDYEWTSGVQYVSNVGQGVNERYYDLYTESNTSAKPGDALGTKDTTNPGCAGWHTASPSKWIRDD